MGLGGETSLEHLQSPTEGIPILFCPAEKDQWHSDVPGAGRIKPDFFYFLPGKHLIQTDPLLLQMPVVLINQTCWSQHSPRVPFHKGFVWAEACQRESAAGAEGAGPGQSLDSNISQVFPSWEPQLIHFCLLRLAYRTEIDSSQIWTNHFSTFFFLKQPKPPCQ